jgi:prepilin-type N-terminal cleavage/methylation domain-containing protein
MSDSFAKKVRRSQARAFTLVEVLAAIMLMAIVLPVALQGVSLALAAGSHARYVSEAASLAEAKLNELVMVEPEGVTETSGDFGADWPSYRWEAQTVARDFSTIEVQVSVLWIERGEERAFSVSTLMFIPDQTTTTTQ